LKQKHDEPLSNFAFNFNMRRYSPARAGRGGRAITLVSQYDIALVHQIEELTT